MFLDSVFTRIGKAGIFSGRTGDGSLHTVAVSFTAIFNVTHWRCARIVVRFSADLDAAGLTVAQALAGVVNGARITIVTGVAVVFTRAFMQFRRV